MGNEKLIMETLRDSINSNDTDHLYALYTIAEFDKDEYLKHEICRLLELLDLGVNIQCCLVPGGIFMYNDMKGKLRTAMVGSDEVPEYTYTYDRGFHRKNKLRGDRISRLIGHTIHCDIVDGGCAMLLRGRMWIGPKKKVIY